MAAAGVVEVEEAVVVAVVVVIAAETAAVVSTVVVRFVVALCQSFLMLCNFGKYFQVHLEYSY